MLWVGFVALFVVATVACLWSAWRALSFYDVELRRPMVVFLLLTAVWGLSNAVLLLPFAPVSVMHASYLVGLVVGFATVAAWLWLCSAYAGYAYHYDRRLQTITLGAVLAVSLVKGPCLIA